MAQLTSERLREVLGYEESTGIFRWLPTTVIGRGLHRRNGVAGFVYDRGRDKRRKITVDGKEYVSSRLAWLWMTGAWPQGQIDHKDGDPTNDAWANLRDVTHSQNARNAKCKKTNVTGLKGVHKRTDAWGNIRFIARIHLDGVRIFLGLFRTPEEAQAAYIVAAKKHHGEFARLS